MGLPLFSQYSLDEKHDTKNDRNTIYERLNRPFLWVRFRPIPDHCDAKQYPEPQYLLLPNDAYLGNEWRHQRPQNDAKRLYVLPLRCNEKNHLTFCLGNNCLEKLQPQQHPDFQYESPNDVHTNLEIHSSVSVNDWA